MEIDPTNIFSDQYIEDPTVAVLSYPVKYTMRIDFKDTSLIDKQLDISFLNILNPVPFIYIYLLNIIYSPLLNLPRIFI